MQSSLVAGVYEQAVDRESAFELLQKRAGIGHPAADSPGTTDSQDLKNSATNTFLARSERSIIGINRQTRRAAGRNDRRIRKSAARSVGSSIAREITRGLLGSMLGRKRR